MSLEAKRTALPNSEETAQTACDQMQQYFDGIYSKVEKKKQVEFKSLSIYVENMSTESSRQFDVQVYHHDPGLESLEFSIGEKGLVSLKFDCPISIGGKRVVKDSVMVSERVEVMKPMDNWRFKETDRMGLDMTGWLDKITKSGKYAPPPIMLAIL